MGIINTKDYTHCGMGDRPRFIHEYCDTGETILFEQIYYNGYDNKHYIDHSIRLADAFSEYTPEGISIRYDGNIAKKYRKKLRLNHCETYVKYIKHL